MRSNRAGWLLLPFLLLPAQAGDPDEDVEGRAKWFADRRRSPNGENPAELRLRSVRQLRALQRSGRLAAPDGGDSWVPLGPSPLFDGGSAFTGRITAFAPHPTNAQVIWV